MIRGKIKVALLLGFAISSLYAQEVKRDIKISKRYLNIPVQQSQERKQIAFDTKGNNVRKFVVRLSNDKPDYWVSSDVSEFAGKTLSIAYPEKVKGFDGIYQSDQIAGTDSLYREVNRPQFHFTSRIGWNNDPNGLVYHKGEYHLFYQHNPYEANWENMHWGHAISKDLLHWQEFSDVLYPDPMGAMFSGSAVVDLANTSGFQKGNEQTLVAAYTAHREGIEVQCIAYSNDLGRTWNKYEKNPVIDSKQKWNSENTRDPKIFWSEPTKKWVMVLFEKDGHSIYNSGNLKDWTYKSHIRGFWECPEMFPLSVDGNSNNKKWVMYGASGTYMIGNFNGETFNMESGKHVFFSGNQYASQTYNNIPESDGRRIQIGWGTIPQPGMAFTNMMTFPTQLTLRTTRNGVRLFSEPIAEINQLHKKSYQWSDLTIDQANTNLQSVSGDLFHIKMKVEITDGTSFDFQMNGNSIIRYDMNVNKINGTFYEGDNFDSMTLELLIDRTSMEAFADNGKLTLIAPLKPAKNKNGFEFRKSDPKIKIHNLEVHELKPIW